MLVPKPGLFNFKKPQAASEVEHAPAPTKDLSFAEKVLARLGLVSATEAADPNEPEAVRIRQTMHQAGYLAAGRHEGAAHGLSVNLTRILSNLHEQFDGSNQEQEAARKQKQAEINTVEAEISFRHEERATLERRIENKQKEITTLKDEIHTLRSRPEDMHLPEPSRLTLWISGLILGLLTVYLFVFYSSAIYSAFYKEFSAEDNKVVRAIFDAQAIPNALKDGLTELLMIVTLPAAFLGLGYLIHKFLEQKHWTKYLKVGALLVVTFIFDAILAYDISEKIYELNRQTSITTNEAKYSIAIAVTEMPVWTILFAGFVVYVIWGFIFDFFVESNRLNNKVAVAITERQEKIDEMKAETASWETAIDKVKEAVLALQTRKNQLEAQLLGVIIPAREWQSYLSEFAGGWLEWMAGVPLSPAKQNDCKTTLDEFVKRHLGDESILSYRATNLNNLPLQGRNVSAN